MMLGLLASASPDARADTPVPCPCPMSLPVEMVAHVLQFLSQPDLRRAAFVSCRFRAAALQAGLYILRSIYISHGQYGSDCSYDIDILEDVVCYAKQQNIRVALVIEFAQLPPVEDTGASIQESWEKKLSVVLGGSLQLLVSLTVTIPNALRPALHTLLRPAAPNLQTFEITRLHEDETVDEYISLPRDLFGGRAAKLRSVILDGVSLEAEPVPAFERVHHLRLAFVDRWPKIFVNRHFPCLRHLRVHHTKDDFEEPLPYFRFTGLALKCITIEDDHFAHIIAHIDATTDLRSIPVVRHYGGIVHCVESMWHDGNVDLTDLSAYLRAPDASKYDDANTALIVSPSSPSAPWRRVFHLQTDLAMYARCPIGDLPGSGSTLTYLRMGISYLRCFLGANIRLPALRRFRVDLHEGARRSDMPTLPVRQWEPRRLQAVAPASDVLCPALDELVIFAMDEKNVIQPDDAAQLGRLLGTLEQNDHKRARLVLLGVDLAAAAAEARDLVDRAFSAVIVEPFAGRYSLQDLEGGLWAFGE